MPPPILILVPTRGRPALLVEALRSVLAQSDADWRAVVADDGPGDGEPAERAVAAAGLPPDPRIAFVRASGRSPGSARNAALHHGEDRVLGAEADLVALLDDDDLWRPEHLRASRAALAEAPADATFAHGAAVTRDAAGGETPYQARDEGPFHGRVFAALLRRDFVATSTVVLRAEGLRAQGLFREDLAHGEDWDVWLKLARAGPVAWVPEPLAVYRAHAGNTSLALVEKAADQAAVLEHWWVRRHFLSRPERRVLRRELARRYRRHVKRLLAEGAAPRREVRRAAWDRLARVPHLHTVRAAVETVFGRAGPR